MDAKLATDPTLVTEKRHMAVHTHAMLTVEATEKMLHVERGDIKLYGPF